MSTLQTLDRGLRALEVISHSPAGISVAELAKELGIHRAICYRIVATLEEHLLVSRTDEGRVRLAVGVAVLASRFESRFTEDARPLLHALANETHATAFISAAEGKDCVAVLVAEPEGTVLTVGYRVGSRHPLTKGAAGIAILAARPEDPADPEAVRQARRDGYSLTRGELERGAVGIAAGIRAPAGLGTAEHCVGVVAIDGLDTDLAADAVMRAARELEQLLSA
ncbi:transcriptional regulator [Prauserella sp. PE36]|uniref:Transcriptional regulator n=1 Tax=Prauserella endophytica TaxID=1592324 RepID=A0ABY2SBM0_9PSEU|nr:MULTISPECIES: helix-turn-helix domain-containing protein [Prauserella]PXY29237.1 transcriptional regulator [Prauserella coralliicola]RBM21586.1 transcriptional regulator [Prauserella sp. PE36]TKG72926.1 transcriptional regulator [Prauserella endophytica]